MRTLLKSLTLKVALLYSNNTGSAAADSVVLGREGVEHGGWGGTAGMLPLWSLLTSKTKGESKRKKGKRQKRKYDVLCNADEVTDSINIDPNLRGLSLP